MRKPLLWLVLALVALCMTVWSITALVLAVRFFRPAPVPVASPGPTNTSIPQPATAIPATRETTPSASPTTPMSEALLRQIRRIEQDVEELRGLKPKRTVPYSFLTSEELRQKVENDFFKDYSEEDAFHDVLELWTFGLLQRDFDLYHFYRDMYAEQIAGFYDDEDQTMYIVKDEAGFPAHARLTYAHEFTHALQDQYWDFDETLHYNDESCEKDTEYCGGVQALIEGDASLVENLWFFLKATPEEQQAIREYYSNFSSPVFDQAPSFMQADLLFPYRQGQDFVMALYKQGGFDAINQAFADPPRSTEQILHPERYPHDQPLKVTLPDIPAILGEGWEAVVEYNALGEFWIYLMLHDGRRPQWRLPDNEARIAAEGWAGDAYALYYNKAQDAVVLVMDFRWDTPKDGQEFAQTFITYLIRRFGQPQQENGALFWPETEVGLVRFAPKGNQRAIWVIAPDQSLLEQLWGALGP